MQGQAVIVNADDFGLSESVNEAVERAARDGLLTSASLMVAGEAAADAVARARRLPRLQVGLHLVVIEGRAVLPPREIPALVDARGWFPSGGVGLGFRYAFSRAARAQLRREIAAQFAAFAATGLSLDHANAHKHMHLHPFVGRVMIETGARHGLRAIRVPWEAPRPGDSAGAAALRAWCGVLRRQARAAGIATNDAVAGLRDTGRMTQTRLQAALAEARPGLTEIYLHPASRRDPALDRFMPRYQHVEEFHGLLAATVPAEVRLTSYTDHFAA